MAGKTEQQSIRLMGKKRGMLQLFDEQGFVAICTVIEVEPNIVTQIKTKEKEGYNALQLGFGKLETKDPRTLEKRVTKPMRGHFQKGDVAPRRHLAEVRTDTANEYSVGQEVSLSVFEGEAFFDVTGTSIGKGYQGVMKKYGFRGGRATHGNSRYHRGIGSTGMRSTPGRCLPGGKRASHMGNERKTVQNVPLFQMKTDENLLILRGQVPGPVGSVVTIAPAIKKQGKKK